MESLSLPTRAAIDAVAGTSAGGVVFDAVGDLSPESLSHTGRRQLSHMLRTRGLSVAGVGVGLARGFDIEEQLENRIARTLAAMRLAQELGAGFAFNHVGPIPPADSSIRRAVFVDVLRRIANEANRVGADFAIHLSQDSPQAVAELLATTADFGLSVLYDPANAMARGWNAYDGLVAVGKRLAAVFCKDVVRTGASVTGFEEATIGDGEIDWQRLCGLAAGQNFRGPMIVARERGQSRLADIRTGIDRLSRSLI